MTITARVLQEPRSALRSVELQVAGETLTATIEALRTLPNPEDRLSDDEVEAARQQAAEIVQRIVETYERRVSSGEVGIHGSARASEAPPASGDCPTGLLYGKVQSGKTRAMVFTAAMCFDNGFRVVIVLTSDNVKLVDQTTNRFLAIDGPIPLHSNDRSEWEADEAHIRTHLAQSGLLVVCSKNGRHQETLLNFLRRIGADGYPAVILDDEADQATPDTTRAARSRGGAGAPAFASRTNRLIIRNDKPDELGDSLREILRHNVYVQVTATPYALLLQGIDDPLRPDFTFIVEPGPGYLGGEWYFSEEAISNGSPPLYLVAPDESLLLPTATSDNIPAGLQMALSYFCLAAAAKSIRPPAALKTYTFLCHTSHRQDDHDQLESLIRDHLSSMLSGLNQNPIPETWQTSLANARDELRRTIDLSDSEFEDSVQWLRRRLRNRNVSTVNARGGELTFRPGLNFLIGGNILGRGLTLPNLLVSYYLRSPRAGQMDTMLQHARMFGYSERCRDFIRVFIPQVLARRFREIVVTEAELRDYLSRGDPSRPVPVRVVQSLRATRRNVLDTSSLSGYRPGQQVYPMEPEYRESEISANHLRLTAILERDAFHGPIRDGEFVDVPLSVVKEIVNSTRVRGSLGSWDASAIIAVLDDLAPDSGDQASIYVRRNVRNTGPVLASGSASGPEQAAARIIGKPVLMMFEQVGRREDNWDGAPFWFPTVVFPLGMDARIFNID